MKFMKYCLASRINCEISILPLLRISKTIESFLVYVHVYKFNKNYTVHVCQVLLVLSISNIIIHDSEQPLLVDIYCCLTINCLVLK